MNDSIEKVAKDGYLNPQDYGQTQEHQRPRGCRSERIMNLSIRGDRLRRPCQSQGQTACLLEDELETRENRADSGEQQQEKRVHTVALAP